MLDISSFLNVNGGTASNGAASQKAPATGASGDFASQLAASMGQKPTPQNNSNRNTQVSSSGKNIPAEAAIVAQNFPSPVNTTQNDSEENALPAELSAQAAQIFPSINVEPEISGADQPVQIEAPEPVSTSPIVPSAPLPYVTYETVPANYIEEPADRSVMTDSTTLSAPVTMPASAPNAVAPQSAPASVTVPAGNNQNQPPAFITDASGRVAQTAEAFMSRVDNTNLIEIPSTNNIDTSAPFATGTTAQTEAPAPVVTMEQVINPAEMPSHGAVVYMSDITGESNILRAASSLISPAAAESTAQAAQVSAESTARYIDDKSIWTRLNLQQLAAATTEEVSGENKQAAQSLNNMPADEDAQLLKNAIDARFPVKSPLKTENIFNRPLEMTVKVSGEAQKAVYAERIAQAAQATQTAQTQTLATDVELVVIEEQPAQTTRMMTPPERQTPYTQPEAKPAENMPREVQAQGENKGQNVAQQPVNTKADPLSADEGQPAMSNNNNSNNQGMQEQPRRRNLSDTLMERNNRNQQAAPAVQTSASSMTRDAQASDNFEVRMPGDGQQEPQQAKTEERSLRWESARDAANLAKMVQQAGQNGVSKLTVRLTPEHLGRLEIQLTELNGRMDAKIVANSNESRALLAANGDVIRQQLADKGIHIDNMDFSFHDSLARQDRNDQGQAGRETNNNSRFSLNNDSEDDFEETMTVQQEENSRLYA